jgi:hypothetical protein
MHFIYSSEESAFSIASLGGAAITLLQNKGNTFSPWILGVNTFALLQGA